MSSSRVFTPEPVLVFAARGEVSVPAKTASLWSPPRRDQSTQAARTGHTDQDHIHNGENAMAVARVSKITAASSKGFEEAVLEGMKRATKTLRGVTGFEVISQKGKVEDGKIV